MKIKVHQHIYGRNKEKGFSTLKHSPDITAEELKVIERNCKYELPTSLYSEVIAEKPVKYVFYKLNDEKVVIGKGTYIGKDEFGREGNYLFHNLIFQIKDILFNKIDPSSLITHLIETNSFINNNQSELNIDCLELDLEECKVVMAIVDKPIYNNSEFHTAFFYSCFRIDLNKSPIVIEYEKDSELFEFLFHLYSIISRSYMKELSFNTLWFKDMQFDIRGIKKGFPLPVITYSIKVNLMDSSCDIKIEMSDAVVCEYAKYTAEKVLNNKESLLLLYSLQETIVTHEWNIFLKLYNETPNDVRKVVYNFNREKLLEEILHGNIELLHSLMPNLSDKDYNKIYNNKAALGIFIEHQDEVITKKYIDWFYGLITEDKKDIYNQFVNNSWLLDLLLEKLKGETMKTDSGIEIIHGLIDNLIKLSTEDKNYDEGREEKILSVLCDMFIRPVNENISELIKAIKKLPDSKNPKNLMLRALLLYRFEDSGELISFIKEDKNILLVYELLNNGMNLIDWEKYKKSMQETRSTLLGRLFK